MMLMDQVCRAWQSIYLMFWFDRSESNSNVNSIDDLRSLILWYWWIKVIEKYKQIQIDQIIKKVRQKVTAKWTDQFRIYTDRSR